MRAVALSVGSETTRSSQSVRSSAGLPSEVVF
jgi:hypothetical protein